jgi:hypothetical protein
MLKRKKYLQIQSNTHNNPYLKQRTNINKIIEETKAKLNTVNIFKK